MSGAVSPSASAGSGVSSVALASWSCWVSLGSASRSRTVIGSPAVSLSSNVSRRGDAHRDDGVVAIAISPMTWRVAPSRAQGKLRMWLRSSVMTAKEWFEGMRQARPPTLDNVTVLWDGRRLDSREAVMEWLAEVGAEACRGC
jgi:hypothetical protein